VPWIALADTPTPITELPAPAGFRGRLFAKRDDLTSTLFGGNKVRKFEYLLADAERHGAQPLVTMGGIGSNQALAAALHGRARGHAVDLSLVRQPVTEGVRRAVRGMVAAGAQIRYADSKLGGLRNVRRALRDRRRAGEHPYYFPFGATNALGALGYVSAALELAGQVRDGVCPQPDSLFVAAGSCGTAAGLLAGIRLAGLPTRLIAVGVVYPSFRTRALVLWHANRTTALLSRLVPSTPRLRFSWRDLTVLGDYLGAGYGHATAAAQRALDWARPHLMLETTYTGKALAACLDHCGPSACEHAVLFWNTHNASQFPMAAGFDGLPDRLRALLTQS
jgi:D-cysteine desulfhydrase